MKAGERRRNRRYTLNHPVALRCKGARKSHFVEILDAGVSGMRVKMADMRSFFPGRELELSCQSLVEDILPDRARVVCRCLVVWKDTTRKQVGLRYLQ